MNWPRARLWLIVTFLLLDVLLAWVLFSGTGLPYRWQQPKSRALTGQLARYGLELQVTLPTEPGSLALQRLERVPVPDWLLPQIYPAGVPVPQTARTAEGGTNLVYRGDTAITVVEPGGRVTVYYVEIVPYPPDSLQASSHGSTEPVPAADGAEAVAGDPPEATAEALPGDRTGDQAEDPASAAAGTPVGGPGGGPGGALPSLPLAGGVGAPDAEAVTAVLLWAAEAWVHDWGGPPDGGGEPRAVFDPATGLGYVAWRPDVAGLPLYGSQMRVTLAQTAAGNAFRVGHWERRWFRALGPVGDPRPAVPAQTALLRLAGHLESIGAPGGTITGVALGYYTGEYQADAWEVPPVWRLDLADGRFFYVNALTGELETD